LKNLATDPTTNPKVKKKVLAVLGSWSRQFKDDRNAATIAGLYRQVKPAEPPRRSAVDREQRAEREREAEQKRKAKEAKRKAKEDRLKSEEEARSKKTASRTTNTTRKPFNFEQVGFSYGVVNIALTSIVYRKRHMS
jgi:FKBP-type peptidyl-prolyl cis-trans isomerase